MGGLGPGPHKSGPESADLLVEYHANGSWMVVVGMWDCMRQPASRKSRSDVLHRVIKKRLNILCYTEEAKQIHK